MNAGSTTFKGIVAALAVIAAGIGCSHNDGDHRLSRSERRSQSHSDRSRTAQREGGTATVAEAPPLTYANQPATVQNTTYSTQAPVGTAPQQDTVVTATATNAPAVTYSAPPVVPQDRTDSSIAADAAAQRQDASVTVRAPEAPPATKSETPTHAVSNDEFWVNGNWNWGSNSFTWQPGRMERLRANQLYHPATWSQSAQGWDFTPAYWQ